MEQWPTRMNLVEKIKRCQISEQDFDIYCSTFVKNWTRYRLKEMESDWYLVKNRKGRPVRLTRDTVAYHLLGKYWLSTFPPEYPRYICIDIDLSPGHVAIYRIAKDWLKHLMVFQSSERGGLHVYAFLSTDFAIRWFKLFNMTKIELQKRDIEIKPGVCEVPLDPKVSLRLPLGWGSFLLDPETLVPLGLNLKQAINFVSTQIRYLTIDDLFPWLKGRMGGKKEFH